VQVSTNAVLHNIAFYTADSGIAAGRAALNNLKIADAGSWDKLLFNNFAADVDKQSILVNGVACVPDPCWTLDDIIDQIEPAGRTIGPANYTLTVADTDLDLIDVDHDGNNAVDSDDTVFLTSTLVSPYRNADATIRTTVRGGGEAYAQEHYNASSSGEAGMESEKVNTDDGNRWD
jgi:hypothetical protein